MKQAKLLLPLLLTGLFLIGCGPKPRTSESVLDSPEFHISQGMKLVDRGDYDEAEIAFNKALELDDRAVSALSGLALVEAGRGDFKKAHDLANEAVKLDKNNSFAWAVRGHVKSLWRNGDDWAAEANRDFDKALDLKPGSERILYWYGLSRAKQYDFSRASDLFSQVIAQKGEYGERADVAFEQVQKVLRAAPGSKLGMKIALLDQITRADLAVLFMEELKLREVYDRRGDVQYDTDYTPPGEEEVETDVGADLPPDVVDHWARTWIRQVLDMGAMEAGSDGDFAPDKLVTRAEYALLLQNILMTVLQEPDLATRYIGEESRFKDMNSSTAAYNAAALCVDRGVMNANVDGTFRPMETVSGADALLIIRQLQNYLRMEF